jgi:hypothetical protein
MADRREQGAWLIRPGRAAPRRTVDAAPQTVEAAVPVLLDSGGRTRPIWTLPAIEPGG